VNEQFLLVPANRGAEQHSFTLVINFVPSLCKAIEKKKRPK
jgi:hypothetical protein